jgi:ferritin-like metal-binding protein YciE
MDNLTELLEEQIKDLYNAENQLLKALPRMAKKASSDELKEAFTLHTEETRTHIERLEQVCEELEISPKGKVCAAMKGLIEEGKEVLEEDGHDGVIDAALIAAAQRVEHYEISAYGTVRAMAELLGHENVARLFEETLEEEEATDEKLTEVAQSAVYPGAPKSEGDMGEVEEEEAPRAKSAKGGNRGGGASRGGKSKKKATTKSRR